MEDKALDGTEIYVSVTEGITEDHIKLAMDRLPGWRREYVEKRALSARIEGTFSYLLLQKLTLERFGLSDTARFTYGKYGKPYYSDIDVFFSISHCKTAVAAAVSKKEIGVDIMDDRRVNENIALRICSDLELEEFREAKDKQRFLLKLWCKKESIVKKSGLGFSRGFKTVETGKNHCRIFSADKYTVSAAVDPGDTVNLTEISFTELICR
ncbi:MAG: 4'-phosphopantetheinyl transferase superfamily protein [Ruminococcaceae bacterium]|nr:4'-phosphopantetheinyl transferase superfamily protein [Oscillospiraceae bacterium]